MDPKKRCFWKIPQDFELLKKVPQNIHQTSQFGWNRYIGIWNLSHGAFQGDVKALKQNFFLRQTGMFNCWCLNVFSFRFPASGCLQSASPGTASLSCSCSSWSSPPLPASSGRCQSPWGYWWWPYTSYSLLCRSAYRNVFSQFEQQIFQWKYIPRHTDVQEWKCLFWTFPAFHEALLHSVHLQGKLFALQHLIDYFNWTYLKFIAAPSKSPGNLSDYPDIF